MNAAEGFAEAAGSPVAQKATMTEGEFHALYLETARPLKIYLQRLTCDTSVADDLLQETFIRILKIELPPMDPAQMRSYLYRTATNLARDRFRRARFEAPPPDPGTADRRAEPSHLRADVDKAFSQVSVRERELVWLAYVEGASHREIAAITGLRESSIRPLLYRARQKLARLLGGTA